MRIDGAILGQNTNLTGLSNILARLDVGDVLRAQVLEIASSEILLKLLDGSAVKAATEVPVDAKPGDFVDFIVKNKEDGRLFLETVKSSQTSKAGSDMEGEVKKQLLTLSIKPNEENTVLAKELLSRGIAFTRENFDKFTALLDRFKALSPAEAVFLESSNIKVEEKNIHALKQLIEGRFKVSSQLEDFASLLDKAGEPEAVEHIARELTHWENLKAEKQGGGAEPGRKPAAEDGNSAGGRNIVKELEDRVVNLLNREAAGISEKADAAGGAVKNVKWAADLEEILQTALAALKKNNVPENLPEKLKAALQANDALPQHVRKEIGDLLDGIFGKMDTRNLLLQKKEAPLRDMPVPAAPEHAKETVHKALRDIFVRIDSENLKEVLDAKSIYRDAFAKLEIIRQGVEQSALPMKNELLGRLDTIENNLKFINELNNYNTYVQIPLHMWNKNTTGELYILKNNTRRKRIDPENVTLFISLDTQNIGRVESLLSVSRKNISLNMRVEDPSVLDFVRDRHKDLYTSLLSKGYRLVDLKCRLIEEDIGLLDAEEALKKEFSGGKKSIDYKI